MGKGNAARFSALALAVLIGVALAACSGARSSSVDAEASSIAAPSAAAEGADSSSSTAGEDIAASSIEAPPAESQQQPAEALAIPPGRYVITYAGEYGTEDSMAVGTEWDFISDHEYVLYFRDMEVPCEYSISGSTIHLETPAYARDMDLAIDEDGTLHIGPVVLQQQPS